MKTKLFILLLILSLNIYAQDIDYIRNYYNDSIFCYQDYLLPKDTFIEYKPNIWVNEYRLEYIDSTQWYFNIDQFVKLFDEYEKYCYNDSVEDCGYHTVCESETVYGWSNCWVEWDCKWIHPYPTFMGFKEWLKTKL